MDRKNDDSNLDEFLRKNSSKIPEPSPLLKEKLFAQLRQEKMKASKRAKGFWFLRLVTPMALGLVAIVSTVYLSKQKLFLRSELADQQEVSQFIDESFQLDDDFDADDLDL
ncbi:MAG: hypothetical protein KA116_09660 [Proteobacteria bacterium]|nr:hypothetical protein [Pseudomonadota bacterium]